MKLSFSLYRRIAHETKHIRSGEAVYLLQNGRTTIQDLNNFKGLAMNDGSEIPALLKFESALTYKEVQTVLDDYVRTHPLS